MKKFILFAFVLIFMFCMKKFPKISVEKINLWTKKSVDKKKEE